MTNVKQSWIIPAIVILSFLALSVWQLGIFNLGGVTPTTATGFAKIKPMLALTSLKSDGRFDATFVNGVGASIYVNSVNLTESYYGKTCYVTTISPRNVSPGYEFKVTADECRKGNPGEVYTLNIEIQYDVIIGGIKSTKTERGTIRGPIDGYGYYSGSQYYKIHRSFDFGGWWIVVIVLSIFLIMESYTRINKSTDLTWIHIVGLYSFMFILCSTLIFIFGVHSFFNTHDGYDISLRIKYGWVIESVIYFIIGLILLIVTEYSIRKADKLKTAITSVGLPVITLLVLSVIFIYPYEIITTIDKLTPETKLLDLGWIVEILIFSIIAIAYTIIIKKTTEHKGIYEWPGILYYTDKFAFMYFIGSVIFFILWVDTLVYSISGFDFRHLLGSVFIGLGGLVLLKISKPISKT